MPALLTTQEIRAAVETAVNEVEILDVHTHLYPPSFGEILLWGIDELLTYHYLVAEVFRYAPRSLTYEKFWSLSKREQADLIWDFLFLRNSPLSEACRGVLTSVQKLGFDPGPRDLRAVREYFDKLDACEYVNIVLKLSKIGSLVMTNNPFDDQERRSWEVGKEIDVRFHSALRLDDVLNTYASAVPRLKEWGYEVDEAPPRRHRAELDGHRALAEKSLGELRRFLNDWIDRMKPLYMAVSLPPDFRFPEDSARGRIIAECILPVSRERNVPFALMIGVKKLIHPQLQLAGDGLGKADMSVVEHLCREYPDNKFLVTLLSRENQHELVVLARKFRNLMLFGCWWFMNNPSVIEEITRERMEMLGTSFIPQHSDARVLDQLLYKWDHSRRIIADVLCEKYVNALDAGWRATEVEVKRDVAKLFRENFKRFLNDEAGE